MKTLYPAHFKEWDTKQGTEYSMYFHDFTGIYVKSGTFIDVCRAAKMALKNVTAEMDELPTPSAPRDGDIMLEVDL